MQQLGPLPQFAKIHCYTWEQISVPVNSPDKTEMAIPSVGIALLSKSDIEKLFSR
jgi:hypothetical protein